MSGLNRSFLERNATETATAAAGLAPAQPHLPKLSAPRGLFLRDRLHGLRVQMQPFFGRAAREFRKIESREKSPFAIEHCYLQFVAVIPDEIHFAGEITQKLRVFVLEPQPLHFGIVESTFHGFF
jgi:hypothetical protein